MHGLTLSLTGDYRPQDRQAVDVSEAGGAVFDRKNRTETASFVNSAFESGTVGTMMTRPRTG
jgi:hypothetical protein